MTTQGYDSGRYWEEKYNTLKDLVSEMKEGKLTVLIRRFQARANVSYRKGEEYAMVAIDDGYMKASSRDRLLDADEAGRELKAGRFVYFQASSLTANPEKTETRYDVEKGVYVQIPEEEDENVTEYMKKQNEMKADLRQKLREKRRPE
jgi:hypothetical protein